MAGVTVPCPLDGVGSDDELVERPLHPAGFVIAVHLWKDGGQGAQELAEGSGAPTPRGRRLPGRSATGSRRRLVAVEGEFVAPTRSSVVAREVKPLAAIALGAALDRFRQAEDRSNEIPPTVSMQLAVAEHLRQRSTARRHIIGDVRTSARHWSTSCSTCFTCSITSTARAHNVTFNDVGQYSGILLDLAGFATAGDNVEAIASKIAPAVLIDDNPDFRSDRAIGS